MIPLMSIAHAHTTLIQPALSAMTAPPTDLLRLFFAGDFFAANEREARFPWGEAQQMIRAAITFGCVCDQCGKTNEHYGACSDDFAHPDQVTAWMKRHRWATINGRAYCPSCIGRITLRR